MTAGITFANPANTGVYLAGLAANAVATVRARAEVKHKELINQFDMFKGVRQGMKDLILEAIDNEYLIEIKHEMLGYLNQTPRQMLDHLLNRGGALHFAVGCVIPQLPNWNNLSKHPRGHGPHTA